MKKRLNKFKLIVLLAIILFASTSILFANDFEDKNTNIKQKYNPSDVKTKANDKENEEKKIKDIQSENNANIVILDVLDKISAKTYKYKIKINEEITFKRLKIKPIFCWKSSPDEKPENKVLLDVIEKELTGDEKQIFYGWMFSSKPEISSIQHPMYDITIVDCKNN